MLAAALCEQAQELRLVIAHLGGDIDPYAHAHVAATTAVEARHATPTQHEFAPGLGARRDFEFLIAVQRLQCEPRAERRLGDGDRQFREQIVTVAHESLVRGDTEMDVEIARRTTAGPGRATTGEPQRRPGIDACWHLDLIRLLRHDPSVAVAGRTRGGDDLARAAAAVARRSRHHLAEEALAHTLHLAASIAFRTGDRLCSGAGAAAAAI